MHGARRRIYALFGLLSVSLALGGLAVLPHHLSWLHQGEKGRKMAKTLRAWWRGASFMGDERVVLQPHWNDCGAASLKMVLAAHGIKRNISELDDELGTTAEGVSLLHLRLVAAAAGLPGRSWVLSPGDLNRVPLPAIAFVDGNHFVVVKRLLGPRVLEVDDPALGRLRWPIATFRQVWSGEMLVFEPGWTPWGGA